MHYVQSLKESFLVNVMKCVDVIDLFYYQSLKWRKKFYPEIVKVMLPYGQLWSKDDPTIEYVSNDLSK